MKIIGRILPKRMNNRILLYSMVIGLISIIITSYVFIQINEKIIFDTLANENEETSYYVKSNIERVIESVNAYSKLVISNEVIQRVLDDRTDSVLERQSILLQLNTLMETSDFISDIYVADMTDNLYVTFKEVYDYESISDNYRQSAMFRQIIEDKGSYSIHLNGGDFFEGYKGPPLISFARAIRDLNSQEIIGAMVINIPASYLINEESRASDNQIRELYVVEDQKVLIHSGILEESPVSYSSVLEKKDGYFMERRTKDGNAYLVSSLWIEEMNWHVVSVISADQSQGEIDGYLQAFAMVYGLNLIFIFLGVTLFSRFFVKPINRMIDKIKLNGDNLEEIKLKSDAYELKQLEREYNQMIVRIRTLIKNKVGEQRSLRKKELELLQSQIKPHFLYNTLDTIKLLAKKGENERAFQAVSALGKFYRGSLSKGEETISILDEMKIVESYMKIQRFRYGDIFTYDTYLEPALKHKKILKLILQPLVENALYHGIRPKGEPGHISVKIIKESNIVKFQISDDGVGFDPKILEEEDPSASKINGFGINNTIERLKIFYGDHVAVSIESARGQGTAITIEIPVSVIMFHENLIEEKGDDNHGRRL